MKKTTKRKERVPHKGASSKAKLTARETAKRKRKYKRDQLVRKIRKTHPLCITENFREFAIQCGWDDAMTDAAALVMHKYFLETRKKKKKNQRYLSQWIGIHSGYFTDILGSSYKPILDQLEAAGFLERKTKRKYIPGKLSSRFRLGGTFLWQRYKASYRLQTERLQQRFLSIKARLHSTHHQRKIGVKADENLRAAEPIDDTVQISSFGKKITYTIPRFRQYVESGLFTEEQLQVYKQIIQNVYKLRLDISEPELLEIIRTRSKTRNMRCDISALQEVYRSYLEDVLVPRVSIDPRGRMYTPYTNLPREFWDYVSYRNQPLAAIDVKTSQVYCLLGLIRDIDQNYFAGSPFQTHVERLARCRFSRQIESIPGLENHLRRSSDVYQVADFIDFWGQHSKNLANHRKRCYKLFSRFTKFYLRKLDSEGYSAAFDNKGQKPGNFFYGFFGSCSNYLLNALSMYGISFINQSLNNLSDNDCISLHDTEEPTPTRPLYVHEIELNITRNYFINQELKMKMIAYNFIPNLEKSIVEPADVGHENGDVGHENNRENDVGHGCVRQNIPRFRDLFFPCTAEIERFGEVLSGDIYDELMTAIHVKGKVSRDDFKEDFFQFFYRRACIKKETVDHATYMDFDYSERIPEPIRQAFETLLPSIMLFIDICKSPPGKLSKRGKFYKLLPTAMQSVESQIIMECCTNLLKKHPTMFIITLHDCIRCLPKDVETVRAEMERVFAKYLIEPELKVKFHGKPPVLVAPANERIIDC